MRDNIRCYRVASKRKTKSPAPPKKVKCKALKEGKAFVLGIKGSRFVRGRHDVGNAEQDEGTE